MGTRLRRSVFYLDRDDSAGVLPIHLLQSVVRKVARENGIVILVAPF